MKEPCPVSKSGVCLALSMGEWWGGHVPCDGDEECDYERIVKRVVKP